MISDSTIQDVFEHSKRYAFTLVPHNLWQVAPTTIETHDQHGKYGIAFSGGRIAVYSGFIGSPSIIKLESTILHELAHLCVGLRHHHNQYFRRIEKRFSGHLNKADMEKDEQTIIKCIPYKWTVVAHLENGSIEDLGGVHRKTKRWSEYTPAQSRSDSFQGITVLRYEFIQNR